MATIKKYNGNSWENAVVRKFGTATEAVENPLYSDGTAITAYSLKGNTVQNGTPTPSNPVEVNGVGVRTENLLNNNPATQGDGYVDNALLQQNGTLYTSTAFFVTEYIPITEGTYYYYNNLNRVSFSYINFYDSSKTNIGSVLQKPAMSQEGLNFTELVLPTGTAYIRMNIDKQSTLNCLYDRQLSTYIPYGFKIPISSGGVTTNVYLGSTQTIRQIGKYIFDGSNIFTTQRSAYRNNTALFATTVMTGTGITNRPSMNNYFVVPSSGTNPQGLDYACSGFHTSDLFSNYYYLRVPYDVIGMTDSNTDNEFITALNSWLSSLYNSDNPMIAYYALATAETAAVNEPLMKIGDYADTLSNAASIPTTEGANSITVDTTVQPSEFTATWTGWHDASVKEYDGSDWQ